MNNLKQFVLIANNEVIATADDPKGFFNFRNSLPWIDKYNYIIGQKMEGYWLKVREEDYNVGDDV